MFTGIIEELGKIRQITTNRIQIECKTVLTDLKIGDSIAVNGVCLTIVEIGKDFFTADISQETMRITTFRELKLGNCVNLERAMSANGRFGGHIVSGHIDSTGKIIGIKRQGDFYNLEVELDSKTSKYTIYKGSITINGISLTIAKLNDNIITCAIIPHTFENTNLKTLTQGDYVNIETDILAKYIEKFLSTGDNKSGIDENFLIENGYI
jgi:riboflavin synthase